MTRHMMSSCLPVWQTRPGVRGGEVSAEVGLGEQNDDVEVLWRSQNGLTPIRFDLITRVALKSADINKIKEVGEEQFSSARCELFRNGPVLEHYSLY